MASGRNARCARPEAKTLKVRPSATNRGKVRALRFQDRGTTLLPRLPSTSQAVGGSLFLSSGRERRVRVFLRTYGRGDLRGQTGALGLQG